MRSSKVATLAKTVFSATVLYSTGTLGADAAGVQSLQPVYSLVWLAPFAGVLASIALLPLLAPSFWHRHYGAVALFWTLFFLIPAAVRFGPSVAAHEFLHALLLEYIPFVVLIVALFTISGGIYIGSNFRASPRVNVIFLAAGMVLASFAGTTGASMILIRPLLRANAGRQSNAHVVIFFIFLVSNIGGALTPLGDPPLFLGYLQGVSFLWPLKNLWQPTLALAVLLLGVFYALDTYFARRDIRPDGKPEPQPQIVFEGSFNLALLIALIAAVAASGSLNLGAFTVAGISITWVNAARDLVLVAIAIASVVWTAPHIRELNEFDWEPALEVAKLFAAIFVTIVPAIALLQAGKDGVFGPLLSLLGGNEPSRLAYFWLTGLLSSVLDNAPTYLVFYNAAGGDAKTLMGPLASVLAAISAGAVFMGAMTYIGNAPNFMVKAIAERQGVQMPSFFGYIAWSVCILGPAFVLLTLLFFR